MPRFFSVRHNFFHTRGFPWIRSLIEGFGQTSYCKIEGRTLHYASGDIVALLERDKGSRWSDVLGCGAFPFLIVSEKTIECWEKDGVGTFPIHKVKIANPLPKKLMETTAPNYFWIDGMELRGALIEFEASGFMGVKFCPECGTRTDNISETFNHQYARGVTFSYVFRENTWNGLNLFTTDISPTAFFCTDLVVECARKYKLTNFRFIPVEEAIPSPIKN